MTSALCHPARAIVIAGLLFSIPPLRAEAAKTADGPAAAPSFAPVGFVTVKAYGIDQVTGGGTGPVVEVRTAQEFQAAAERSDLPKKSDRDDTPRVIKVIGDIDLGPLANEKPGNELKSVGKIEVRSNTTIYGVGAGATIHHGVLELHGAHNVIIRNLNFRDLWENDPTGKYDRFGWDYVRIVNSGRTKSHHVWIDHCDFGKAYDGQCDITHGSDLVTVSWCRFAGDERGPHKKSMLIGHSSSAAAAGMDAGRLNVTLHHNWIENIADRAPRVRFGNVHAFDNFVDGAENATISVMKAVTLVENCVYKNVRVATTFSHAADSIAKNKEGALCVINSRNLEPRLPDDNPSALLDTEDEPGDDSTPAPNKEKKKDPNREFELAHNFKSSVERAALRFNPPADWTWENRNQLPYPYKLDPVDEVPALVRNYAGTGKLSAAELNNAR